THSPPPPPTHPAPPPRSSATSLSRPVSASRTRSPVVGPYSAAYLALEMSAIEGSRLLGPQAGNDAVSGQRHQRYLAGDARLEPHRRAGRDVQPIATGRGPVEGQRRVGRREVVVRSDLDRPVAGVLDGQRDPV